MKKYYFSCFCLFFYSIAQAQSYDFMAAQDSLVQLREQCIQEENDSLKSIWNKKFSSFLITALNQNNSIQFNFDSIKSIAILTPEDKSFRIFNWEISFSDNSFAYFGIVQSFNKKKNQILLTELVDKSKNVKRPENVVLDGANWYGAHYYKLIETKKKKKKYYTLLGANWSNPLLRKKLIDIISVAPDGKVKFGESLFQNTKITSKRIVFQYSAEVSMSLRYDDFKQLILFDHLVPRDPSLKGQFEFYGPDMSVDAYDFVKGKWILKEDFDARNQKK